MLTRLHRKQHEFFASRCLYRGFVGGRGAGKSFVGAVDMLAKTRPGRTYMVASPTAPIMRDTTLPTLMQIARDGHLVSSVTYTPYPNIVLSNGATLRLRTADNPDRLRGPNLSGVWLDEASLMKRDAYDIAIACLREAGEQGWLTGTFTPRGPSHWTYEVFATGKPNTSMTRARTGDNPFNPPHFEKTLLEQYGDTAFARQELGGEFVQLEGAEFPGEWFARPDFWFDSWPDLLALKVIALDPSKGTDGKGEDYQAHVMLGVAVENGRYVIYVDADLDRLGVVQMCERTVELAKRFAAENGRPIDSVVCEENGTMGLLQPALDAAAVKGNVLLPYLLRTNTEKKEFRIRCHVGPPLSRYQLRFRRTPGARMLVGQLQSFPRDTVDDGPDALATGLKRVAELLAGAK